jgi:hypothetical protein
MGTMKPEAPQPIRCSSRILRCAPSTAVFLACVANVRAGMTVYDLNDVVRLRLEDISFFAVLLLLSGLGIKFLWNHLAKGFPKIPRLSFTRAFCLTALFCLMMLLVLSMISGARELLTPGAWRRQGSEYRINDLGSETLRRQSIEQLRAALRTYAENHSSKYPAHDFVPEIPEKLWQAPDSVGTRYIYISGLKLDSQTTNIVACEPVHFGDERYALFANGEIRKLKTSQIRDALGILSANQ